MLHIYVLVAVLLLAVADAFKATAPSRSYIRNNLMLSMMSNGKFNVGIVGATGAVGEEILKVMEKRNFPASSVRLFASEKSAGKGTIKQINKFTHTHSFNTYIYISTHNECYFILT